MIKVVLADDHGIVRKGIKLLISGGKNIEIVGEATDGLQAVELVKDLKPNVLIADISMPGMTGIEVAAEVKKLHPSTNVLMLSTYFDEENILESFEAGALGYLPKNSNEDELIHAIEKIAEGKLFYTPSVMEIVGSSLIERKSLGSSIKASLTSREKEILKELVNGSTNKEIGSKLFVSTRTVDAHRRNIMKKLKVNNSAQLVKISMEKKLV
ncbi:response regulator transcription factor [Reichenbachiella sp.]|uniref:response regulator transcription factor n=1 Tax=Reichenbachiella sp. TaxID=2184521 RepID=UPI003BAFE516